MELKKIEINNFRSVKSAEIVFDHNCLVILGKNEAGKSNILKAIAAVFGQYKMTDQDKRKKINNEKIEDSERFIRATIILTDKDYGDIIKRMEEKIASKAISPWTFPVTLGAFLKSCLPEFYITIPVGVNTNLAFDPPKLDNSNLQTITQVANKNRTSNFDLTEIKKLQHELLVLALEIYNERPITCHYWQYKTEHLLPGAIDINSFMNSPSICVPLERIFQLCGRDEILNEFNSARNEDGDYYNLLEQVSNKATETFHEIWPDFKDTVIQLIPDGPQMAIKLSSKAKYNFEDRSDGFKKFISILLMLSTQARANRIRENDLILIDEPDQSLYPTSARFLRDELLKISEKAKVCYTTHSQYMIDSFNIDRHLLIEKRSDVSSIMKADKNSPYSKDELLRNAIGSSIFECIKEKNIVFEGYLDKTLFDKFILAKSIDSKFDSIGKIFLWGISGVEAVTSILQSAGKKFIVVSDSDKTSKEKRIDFETNNPELKSNWLAYGEVISKIVTMEDFFSDSYLLQTINKFAPGYNLIPNKPAITNIDSSVSQDKLKKQEVKNSLVSNCTLDVLSGEYQNFVNALSEKIDKL